LERNPQQQQGEARKNEEETSPTPLPPTPQTRSRKFRERNQSKQEPKKTRTRARSTRIPDTPGKQEELDDPRNSDSSGGMPVRRKNIRRNSRDPANEEVPSKGNQAKKQEEIFSSPESRTGKSWDELWKAKKAKDKNDRWHRNVHSYHSGTSQGHTTTH
jgi:hypothetical protein